MTRLRRFRSFSATIARGLIGLVAFLLLLVVAAMAAAETGWAKNQIRGLIIRQANQYLTATLTIGRLEVAQLDDDPNFPEHGRLTLTLEGGR